MLADGQLDGAGPDPLAGGGDRVEVVQAAAGGIPAVHGVPGRPKRALVGPQIDLPVTHRVERPGLREGLSRGVLQKWSVIKRLSS